MGSTWSVFPGIAKGVAEADAEADASAAAVPDCAVEAAAAVPEAAAVVPELETDAAACVAVADALDAAFDAELDTLTLDTLFVLTAAGADVAAAEPLAEDEAAEVPALELTAAAEELLELALVAAATADVATEETGYGVWLEFCGLVWNALSNLRRRRSERMQWQKQKRLLRYLTTLLSQRLHWTKTRPSSMRSLMQRRSSRWTPPPSSLMKSQMTTQSTRNHCSNLQSRSLPGSPHTA